MVLEESTIRSTLSRPREQRRAIRCRPGHLSGPFVSTIGISRSMQALMRISSRQLFSNLAQMALLVAIYFAAGKVGLMLAFVNTNVTAVWPPTGIALAAFLLLGNQIWPGILLGAFLVNLTNSGSIPASTAIAVGNTLEAFIGAQLVNRFAHGCEAFKRPYDIFKFALLAGVLSTMVSATFGATSLVLSGLAVGANYQLIWLTWWLGD